MRLNVRVIPRAKKIRVEPYQGGLKVYLCEPALQGRANKCLIEIIAQHYNIKKNTISIIKGLRNRDKVVQINETDS
jgi:uncharacterized protein